MQATNRFRLSGNAFSRPEEGVAVPRSVVFLSTEGTKTEPSYFAHLQSLLQRNGNFPYVIHVLRHNRDTDSDPRHVFELIEECKTILNDDLLLPLDGDEISILTLQTRYEELLNHPEKFTRQETKEVKDALTKIGIDIDYHRWLRQIGRNNESDVFAVVIDRDKKSHSRQVLEEIMAACQNRKILFCLSNPCFELWLLLHRLDVSGLSEEEKEKILDNRSVGEKHTYLSKKISEIFHVNKRISSKTMQCKFFPLTKTALSNARRLEQTSGNLLDNIGTSVSDLIAKFADWLP